MAGPPSSSTGTAPSELKVAVIMGGASAEAEVSRSSGKGIADALHSYGYEVASLELDATLTKQLQTVQPDVVFPALHGPVGEDGTIQGYLEVLGLPYVGSNVRGSALAMDKSIAKAIFRSAGLPVSEEVCIAPNDDIEALTQRITALAEQVVLKPRAEGSAIGVMRLRDHRELPTALRTALAWPNGGLAEPFVDGSEVTVGILDLDGATARTMPAIQIETAHGEWYDFNNRYAVGKSQHLLPAPRPARVLQALQDIALAAHRSLGLRDLSRSDFLVDEQQRITLLETNTLPGMTPTSLYPDGAAALGYSFGELLHELVQSALRRARRIATSGR